MKKYIWHKGFLTKGCGHIWVPRLPLEKIKVCPLCHNPIKNNEDEFVIIKGKRYETKEVLRCLTSTSLLIAEEQ